MPSDVSGSPGPPAALPGARSALILLLVINLFNYIDRQILAAVEPEIRRELLAGEADPKFKMGLLSTAFLVSYMLTAPLFGFLAERYRRWALIGVGVVLWSLASGGSGIAWPVGLGMAFWLLLMTRALVGIGEGAYGPIAPAMISDYYPVARRGQVLAWFYLAIPVGGALGYAFGEIVMKTMGWRWAFYLVVPPGLLLGLWCFFMPEPVRGQSEAIAVATRKPGWKDVLGLFRIPSFLLNTLGMTAMTFAIGALAFWMPDFLEQRNVEGFLGLGPRTVFGALTALAGLVATLLGGLAGDWLRPRFPGSYFLVSGMAMILAAPMIFCVVVVPFPWAWLFVFLGVFGLFFNTGPTNTVLANVTHPSIRASGFAINIFFIHVLGDAISPPIIGGLSDLTGNLDLGFTVVAVVTALGGVVWLFGMPYLQRDTELAPTRL